MTQGTQGSQGGLNKPEFKPNTNRNTEWQNSTSTYTNNKNEKRTEFKSNQNKTNQEFPTVTPNTT